MPPTTEVTWKEIHRLTDEDTRIAVIISKSTHFPFPRYSCRVGTYFNKANGEGIEPVMRLFFNPRVYEQSKAKAVLGDEFDRVCVLLQQAQEWIQVDAHYEANRVLDERIAKDEKRANYGKPEYSKTGKTAREREKRKAVG